MKEIWLLPEIQAKLTIIRCQLLILIWPTKPNTCRTCKVETSALVKVIIQKIHRQVPLRWMMWGWSTKTKIRPRKARARLLNKTITNLVVGQKKIWSKSRVTPLLLGTETDRSLHSKRINFQTSQQTVKTISTALTSQKLIMIPKKKCTAKWTRFRAAKWIETRVKRTNWEGITRTTIWVPNWASLITHSSIPWSRWLSTTTLVTSRLQSQRSLV